MPSVLILARNSNPLPVPLDIIFGGILYPRPGFIKFTPVTVPSTNTGSIIACVALTVPTKRNSSSVSITLSYNPDNVDGKGSDSVNFVRSRLSTASSFIRTLFTLSINCFSASCLLINQLCLGLF